MADTDMKAKLDAKKRRVAELRKARIERQKPAATPAKDIISAATENISVDSLVSDIPGFFSLLLVFLIICHFLEQPV